MRFERCGIDGIRFTSRNEPAGQRQKTHLQIRGKHRDWLRNRRESTELHQADMLDQAWLEFKSDYNACEFKLRFL